MDTNDNMRDATIFTRLKEKIHTLKESADFYDEARMSVWKESEKSSFSKFLSMPIWRYNDLLYDKYKNLIPFWRNTLGEETAMKAVKLLVLYSWYSAGTSLLSLIYKRTMLGDSNGIEDLYARYYKPNASGSEMRKAGKDIKAELGIGIRRY